MLGYVYLLRNCKSAKTGGPLGESTVFNYFLKTMVFLNDRGIAKYVANTPDGKGHRLVARFIAGELVKVTHTSPEWLK